MRPRARRAAERAVSSWAELSKFNARGGLRRQLFGDRTVEAEDEERDFGASGVGLKRAYWSADFSVTPRSLSTVSIAARSVCSGSISAVALPSLKDAVACSTPFRR
jgi:hypothetical protein